MKTFKHNDYTINICADITEWAKAFYGMPDGAILWNTKVLQKECMGFAEIEGKGIWIFVPENYNSKELSATIAHEIGHIIPFPVHPEDPDDAELHEIKAEHYEQYFINVTEVISKTIEILNK